MPLDSDAGRSLAPQRRGLNLLHVLLLFSLLLAAVLVSLSESETLGRSAEVVNQLYRDGVAGRTANASSRAPELSANALQHLGMVRQPRRLAGEARFEGTTLRGVFLVEDGAQITLRDVRVDGAFVSLAAFQGREPVATELILEGRVDWHSTSVLPEIALWMPGARLVAHDAAAELSVEGDVVARALEVPGPVDITGKLILVERPQELAPLSD